MSKTKQLTTLGLFSALSIIMVYTPLGMLPWFAGISLTTSHLPTILIALLFGPVYGLVVGLVFGLTTLIRAMTMPIMPLDPLFMNPLVSVLPRACIGPVAYAIYRLVHKANDNIGLVIGAAVGSLTNTLGVLGMIYFIYAAAVVEKLGITAEALIWAVITSSGLLEMAVAVVISFPLAKALKKAFAL